LTRRSIKLWWDLIGTGDILKVLFGEREQTIKAARLMIERFRQGENLSISRRHLQLFARELESGTLGVKYSYHGFYTKLVRKLLILGLLEKGMTWNPKRRTTIRIYQLKVQSITERSPPYGFYKYTWQIAKAWNDMILEVVPEPQSETNA
jgi:hypothetical protein